MAELSPREGALCEHRADEPESRSGGARLRVMMVVANPCTHDARVIKEAEAVAALGHEVRVLCRSRAGVADNESINDVSYQRVPMELAVWRRGRSSAVAEGANAAPRVQRADDDAARSAQATPVQGPLRRSAVGVLRVLRLLLRQRMLRRRVAEAADAFVPNVIHAHDLVTLPASVHWATRNECAVIYDAHELERHRNGLSWARRVLAAWNESRAIRKTAAVITVCDSIAQWLADTYAIPPPVVVMNAPRGMSATSSSASLREDAGVGPSVPFGVYVGKLTFNRGLEQLIEAMEHWQEVEIAMVGPSNVKSVQRIRTLAAQRGVSHRLHLLAGVPPQAVVAYVRSADFGVVPTQDVCLSYHFSLPNKLFEMTFAGLPIAVSDLPEQRAFVERIGNGVTMDQTDPRDIARAMREVYERRLELQLDGAATAIMERDYTWVAQTDKLHSLYDRIAAESVQARTRAARATG